MINAGSDWVWKVVREPAESGPETYKGWVYRIKLFIDVVGVWVGRQLVLEILYFLHFLV